MEIDSKTLKKYSKPSIIANCIYEMTFFGFDQKKIKKNMDELLEMRTNESKRIPLDILPVISHSDNSTFLQEIETGELIYER